MAKAPCGRRNGEGGDVAVPGKIIGVLDARCGRFIGRYWRRIWRRLELAEDYAAGLVGAIVLGYDTRVMVR